MFVYKSVHHPTLPTPVSHGTLTFLGEVRMFVEASFTPTGHSCGKFNMFSENRKLSSPKTLHSEPKILLSFSRQKSKPPIPTLTTVFSPSFTRPFLLYALTLLLTVLSPPNVSAKALKSQLSSLDESAILVCASVINVVTDLMVLVLPIFAISGTYMCSKRRSAS